jgi:hypothetical protein
MGMTCSTNGGEKERVLERATKKILVAEKYGSWRDRMGLWTGLAWLRIETSGELL